MNVQVDTEIVAVFYLRRTFGKYHEDKFVERFGIVVVFKQEVENFHYDIDRQDKRGFSAVYSQKRFDGVGRRRRRRRVQKLSKRRSFVLRRFVAPCVHDLAYLSVDRRYVSGSGFLFFSFFGLYESEKSEEIMHHVEFEAEVYLSVEYFHAEIDIPVINVYRNDLLFESLALAAFVFFKQRVFENYGRRQRFFYEIFVFGKRFLNVQRYFRVQRTEHYVRLQEIEVHLGYVESESAQYAFDYVRYIRFACAESEREEPAEAEVNFQIL